MVIGKVLKEIRKSRGVTQGELSELVNLSQKEISLIENSHRAPQAKFVGKIMEVLNNTTTTLEESEWSQIIRSYLSFYLTQLIENTLHIDGLDIYENNQSVNVVLPNGSTIGVNYRHVTSQDFYDTSNIHLETINKEFAEFVGDDTQKFEMCKTIFSMTSDEQKMLSIFVKGFRK